MTKHATDTRVRQRTATVEGLVRTAYVQSAATEVTAGGDGALDGTGPGVDTGHAEPVIGVPPQAMRICWKLLKIES